MWQRAVFKGSNTLRISIPLIVGVDSPDMTLFSLYVVITVDSRYLDFAYLEVKIWSLL